METSQDVPGPDFDPLDPAFIRDPHPTFADLRERCPVARSEALGGFWMLTRYDDVAAVATDAKRFISGVQNAIPKLPNTGRRGPLHFDPPEHTAYRRALNPVFSDAQVRRMEPDLGRITAELLDRLVARGSADAASELASRLPIMAVGLLFGLDEQVTEEFTDATERFVRSVHDEDFDTTRDQSYRMYDLARGIVERARRDPESSGSAALTALLSIQLDGRPIADEMAVGTIRQIVVAGHVGPALAIASAIRHLAEDLELQERLRREPGLLPDAIEELLRLHAPNTGFSRTPTETVELRGRRIEVDEPIAVNYAAANRDPEVFAEPDAFDLSRPELVHHVAFGRGIHKCLGAELARSEMRIVLAALLAKTSRFTLAVRGQEIPYTQFPEHGPTAVPIVLEAADRPLTTGKDPA